MGVVQSITSIKSVSEGTIKGKVEKKSGIRVGYNYIIVKSYKESQKNDVVKCIYIRSLTNFGFCVIKEGCSGDTKDKHGRDVIDRLKWQQELHKKLQGKVSLPKFIDHFEDRGNYYLVIEHIKGKALHKVYSEFRQDLRHSIMSGNRTGHRFIDFMIQISDILHKLHNNHIVHRDATPNNYMITGRNKVTLIDMEMGYSLESKEPTPPFQLGTYGYMSPQQEATLTPTTAEDIYAFGSILWQFFSGVSPAKLINDPIEVISNKVRFFIPDKAIADLVIQCLLPDDGKRPEANKIRETILNYKNDLRLQKKRTVYTVQKVQRSAVFQICQDAIGTLSTPLFGDDKGWFANNMKQSGKDDKNKLKKAYYASFNRGMAGVIYMLSQAHSAGYNIEGCRPLIDASLELIRKKYIEKIETASAGLHFGSDGIAATLASAIDTGIIEPVEDYLIWINQLLEKPASNSDLINGMAGQVIANLSCASFISKDVLNSRLRNYVQTILSNKDKNGHWVVHSFVRKFLPKKKVVNLSYSEGSAGIIYSLLRYGKTYEDSESLEGATHGLRALIKSVRDENKLIRISAGKRKSLSYGWMDGLGGIALAFIEAYRVTRETQYKKTAIEILDRLPNEITDTNLGQRYGLSGLGEIYLEAWQALGEEKYLQRAEWIAQVIYQLKKHNSKHGIYWLVEGDREPVANFMVGNGGIIHFLIRYCFPEKIGFPLG